MNVTKMLGGIMALTIVAFTLYLAGIDDWTPTMMLITGLAMVAVVAPVRSSVS